MQLPGKFVWFEHASSDIDKARSFYERLFPWDIEATPQVAGPRFELIRSAGVPIGALRSGSPALRSEWTSALSVVDVDASYAAALAAGAHALAPPSDSERGRAALITDPSGATLAMTRAEGGDRADVAQIRAGEWCWSELWTVDQAASLTFYKKVFGYSADTMQTRALGPYYVLRSGGIPRAGVMRSVDVNAPSTWLPYVTVDDCDATAAIARRLGARTTVAPTDMAGVGRFCVLTDPFGARIGLLRGSTAKV